MSNESFTPGPWIVSTYSPAVFGKKQGNGLEPIGFVYRPAAIEDSAVTRRADSDARLIAAAPDLLIAISELVSKGKAFRNSVVETRGVRGMDEHDVALRDAEVAIAKARGETV